MKELHADVVVVGAGPAGLALAAALLERQVDVLCVAPHLAPWAPNYGAWADELVGLDVPVECSWPTARVTFVRHPAVELDREYIKLDSAALYRRWSTAIDSVDRFICGVVSSTLFSGEFWEIRLESGLLIRCRQIFDASGHAARLTERAPMSPAYQTAFGCYAATSADTLGQDTMGLMAWDSGLASGGVDPVVPAFYYEMTLPGGISFLEYTVLAARPLIDPGRLESRVTEHVGSSQLPDLGFERCVIPMGHSVPDLNQACVGFGGAASMVHPATGYMVARTLRAAGELADAYLALQSAAPSARSRALWDVIWPGERVRTHELFRLGLEALLTLDVDETQSFFAAFFSLPDELWRPYQSGTATVTEVATAMWELYGRVEPQIRRKLERAGFAHPRKLLRLLR